MQDNRIVSVILCGGSGMRLWPISRRDHPKQFLSLGDERSLLRQAIARARRVSRDDDLLLVTGEDHRFFVKAALEEEDTTGRILLEPLSRDTAAAVAIAALHVAEADPDAVVAVMPSDHHIADPVSFSEHLRLAAASVAQEEAIALIGIRPDQPHTGYGYILPGEPEPSGQGNAVLAFHEKPDAERAALYVRQGCLWNAGIFVARAATLMTAFERHAPGILSEARKALAAARDDGMFRRPDPDAYAAIDKLSIDYAVMEHFERLIVIPYEGHWSDLGSWNAVEMLFDADADGNRAVGDVLTVASRDTLVISEHRLGVVLGVDHLAVIDTPDAFIVAAKDQLHRMKEVVKLLGGRSEAATPVKVERPWGSYEVLAQGAGYQMKRITVRPGGVLSLQYHQHRSEHWIVIEGEAEVTRDNEIFRLNQNESCFIPLGAVHRLENPLSVPLAIIEVQTGSYLGEDDIVRIEDVYGRSR